MDVNAEGLQRVKELVYDRSHLSFPPTREAQLTRWLVQRMEDGGLRSLDEYVRLLSSDEQEFDRLIGLITTRETYFFRMPAQFEALGATVLPAIVEREGRTALSALARGEQYRMRLRAWSAGCAMGQETYSLAMQVLDAVRYPKAWDVRVLGTDINADGLEIARRGRYDSMKLGRTPPAFIGRYFQPVPGGEVEVTEEVREVTTFEQMNLRNLRERIAYRQQFDVILCRNVMIYFDLPAQQRLITDLSACLRPGGILFTGEGEVLHLYDHSLEVVEEQGCIYYRKSENL